MQAEAIARGTIQRQAQHFNSLVTREHLDLTVERFEHRFEVIDERFERVDKRFDGIGKGLLAEWLPQSPIVKTVKQSATITEAHLLRSGMITWR